MFVHIEHTMYEKENFALLHNILSVPIKQKIYLCFTMDFLKSLFDGSRSVPHPSPENASHPQMEAKVAEKNKGTEFQKIDSTSYPSVEADKLATTEDSESSFVNVIPGRCPSSEDIGRAGWNILHTMAAAYPSHPTSSQKQNMDHFLHNWSYLYACQHCAVNMRAEFREGNGFSQWKPDPVVEQKFMSNSSHDSSETKRFYFPVDSKLTITRFLCELHNNVNHRLNKPIYDCDPSVVLRRWHPGYPNIEDEESLTETDDRLVYQGAADSANSFSTPSANPSSSTVDDSWKRTEGTTVENSKDSMDTETILERLKKCGVWCPKNED